MTREYVAEESAAVAEAVPLLAAALPLIGHEAIRSRGTIGGSLAHADPAAELPAVARALDAEFVVRSASGDAGHPGGGLVPGLPPDRAPPRRARSTEVRFPVAAPGTGAAFQEVARRHGDFAIVGLATSLTLADGAISDARLAFAGVSDVPVRATEAEHLLDGERAVRRAVRGGGPPGGRRTRPTCRPARVGGVPEEGRGRPGPPRRWRTHAAQQRPGTATPTRGSDPDGHHRDGQRRDAHRFGGSAQDTGRLPARRPRPHRDPRRLRARGLRRVHGHRRRPGGALLPDAGRPGGRAAR